MIRIPLPKRLVLTGTILGAVLGFFCAGAYGPSTWTAIGRWRNVQRRENGELRPIRFAIWGATIGLAADLIVHGRPRVGRFNLKVLLFAVFACAILLLGIRCYLELDSPWLELFRGRKGVSWF